MRGVEENASALWTLREFYKNLTTRIVPGPTGVTYFIPLLLLPVALLIPPHFLSRFYLSFTFLPLIFGCLAYYYISGGCPDVISLDLALWSFNLLCLRDPRVTFRRIREKDAVNFVLGNQNPQSGQAYHNQSKQSTLAASQDKFFEEPYPSKLSLRFQWVSTLLVSMRYSYWKIGDPSHDKKQPPVPISRLACLKYAIATCIRGYCIMDLAAFLAQHDKYFRDPSMHVDNPFGPKPSALPNIVSLLHRLPPRLLRSSILAAQAYGFVTLTFFIAVGPALALNFVGILPDAWSPQTWPIHFGPFCAVADFGLRGLWGTWWHQVMRQLVSTPGLSLSQALKFPFSSTRSYALRTISAFLLSGVVHTGLVPPRPPDEAVLSAVQIRLCVAAFFWMQIPGFGVEIIVSKLWNRHFSALVYRSVKRAVVLTWVILWLCLTLPLLGLAFRQLRYWYVYPIPVSLWCGLLGEGYLTWV